MRRSSLRVAVALLFAAGLAPLPVRAQETRSDTLFTVEKYLDLEGVSNPQISPDGSQIVYGRRWVDKLKDRFGSSLWIMNADGSRNRMLADGGDAVWSPDGKRIAYVADGEPKGPQIWVKYVDAEGASQITRLDQAPSNVQWSPDGKSISFTMFVPMKEKSVWHIDMPTPPEGAQWTKPPRVVNDIHFRADRHGYTEPGNRHLFVVSAEGGTPFEVTRGDWGLGGGMDRQPGSIDYTWLPDGKSIAVVGLKVANPDTIYRDSYIYRVDVATGEVRNLTPERGSWDQPVVSPDGKWIAFSGQPYSRMSYRASDLYLMGVDGSGIRKISGDLDRDPGNPVWAPDGSGVYFTAQNQGTSNVYFASVSGGVKPVTEGQQMMSLSSLSKTGVAVGTRSTSDSPADVVSFTPRRPGDVAQLTHVNADLLSRLRLASVEPIWFTSSGNQKVEGWIVKPPSFDPSRKYPMIFEIHGGPHGMYNVGFNPMFQNFAANGFVVFYMNPRGSTGYGTAFGNAIERDYPGIDYQDLMAGVDAVVAKGFVDTNNMFVSGCSGGGVLSSWVIGHTDRFKAAAVRCPVIDWLSFAGETDIPYFTYNFFDKPFWEDPMPWLKHSSLMYVGNIKTPTLLMTGVLDMRTPMPQSEEFYEALKMRGVPARLLRFEGEYHGTGSKPSNWMRTQLYMMDWFRQWGTFASPRRTTAQ